MGRPVKYHGLSLEEIRAAAEKLEEAPRPARRVASLPRLDAAPARGPKAQGAASAASLGLPPARAARARDPERRPQQLDPLRKGPEHGGPAARPQGHERPPKAEQAWEPDAAEGQRAKPRKERKELTVSVEADAAEPAPADAGPERRGVSFPALRGYLREEPEMALAELPVPTLAELEAEVHWLTGAPVLAPGAVAVVCARGLACGEVLAGLERDADATRGLTTPYALGAFGDPKGRVERAIWIVDPARGADAFQDLRSQAAAAALAFGPAKVPLDVVPCGDWGPLEAWATCIDGLTPAIADFVGPGPEKERVLAAAGTAERPLRAYLRRWVATRYCVQACWDDDADAVQAALEAGADPALPVGGSAAEVAAAPGSRAEEVLVQWRLNQQSHVDFVLEIRRYLEQVEIPPIPEEKEEDVLPSPYVTEHIEESGSLEGADWYNRLCRKYG